MNLKKVLLMFAGAVAISVPLYAQTADGTKPPKPEKTSVTTLNGTKFFGIVEVTDDYTIRVSNDSGITRLPIAQLGDTDFKKYGLNKDRSKDGRLWYERKEALEDSQPDKQAQPILTKRQADLIRADPIRLSIRCFRSQERPDLLPSHLLGSAVRHFSRFQGRPRGRPA
jgi:hypothetical protein